MKKIIKGGNIILEDRVLFGYDLEIEDGYIAQIKESGNGQAEENIYYDASGSYVMPGIIDIHSDMIENFIQPRSTAVMGIEMGLREAERVLAMCGITTMFHSVSMYRDGTWDVKEIRQAPQVKKLAKLISGYGEGEHLTRHKYHLRYEIDNLACFDDVKSMIEDGYVDLLSFMDHTPGQGQYQNLEIYRKHLEKPGSGLSKEAFEAMVDCEQKKEVASLWQLQELVSCARERGISVASHDDDSVEKLEINQKLGVDISEFPVTLQVAEKAVENGLLTVLGAPNILLGGSHSGNLSALDAIGKNAASILVSDYYPQSLLQAVFFLNESCSVPLPKAVNFVTLNPAKAAGLEQELGSIEKGKKADILVVGTGGALPVIERVFVDGNQIVDCQYQMGKE